MGRTLRTARVGEKELSVDLVAGTTTVATLPSHGHSVISTADGTEFIMAAPEEGVRKSISVLGITTTTVTVVVRGSTAADVTFTKAGATQLTFAATVDMAVDLMGVSSTRWQVMNVYPDNLAENTTGVVVGTS